MKIGEANRTQSSSLYSANRSDGPNTKKKIIAALCLVSIAYWRTDTPCANTNGGTNTKNVRILNRQGGEIIRCANNMFTKTTV
jgi:hypothetical protein